MKKKFPDVLKRGTKLSFWLVAIAVLIGGLNYFYGKWNARGNYSASKIEMCKGFGKPILSENSGSVRQVMRKECFSAVLVSPSTPKAKIAGNVPGKADICFWRMNKCVAWMHIKNGQIQEKSRKEIPNDYTAILLRGDPGEADIHLLR